MDDRAQLRLLMPTLDDQLTPKTNDVEKPTSNNVIMITTYHLDHESLRGKDQNKWDFLGKTTTTQSHYQNRLMVG